ncbi:P-loop NTPase fold protein [Erysipelothrix anatis]|uniref:KAP family P-loop NTPase fold protein n=1 Tax=Erysipelothrix anatis TaxID=2683713 RepID=UPI00135773C2|nr:P-loop NTPase fold protein [Erysipelothrix anatis]
MIDFNYYGRENFSEVFIERLTSGKNLTINASSHILLNGKWGSGKTMLVEELMKKINLDQGYQTKALILNAWEMDYLEDPNVAIFKTLYDSGYLNIKQLDDDIHGHIKKIKKDYLGIKKGIIDTTNEFVSSKLGVEPLSYGIHGSDFSTSTIGKLREKEGWKMFVEKLLMSYFIEGNQRLVLFIDELDRARPDFVVKIFESMHHLQFTVPITFVYCADKVAIVEMIKGYYGFETKGQEYLEKMIDLEVQLPELTIESVMDYLGNKGHTNRKVAYYLDYKSICSFAVEHNFNFRTYNELVKLLEDDYIDSITSKLEAPHRLYTKNSYHPLFFKDSGNRLSTANINDQDLIPMIIILKIINLTYNSFYLGFEYEWSKDFSSRKKLVQLYLKESGSFYETYTSGVQYMDTKIEDNQNIDLMIDEYIKSLDYDANKLRESTIINEMLNLTIKERIIYNLFEIIFVKKREVFSHYIK